MKGGPSLLPNFNELTLHLTQDETRLVTLILSDLRELLSMANPYRLRPTNLLLPMYISAAEIFLFAEKDTNQTSCTGHF